MGLLHITSMINLEELQPDIEKVCMSMPVKRLGLFGSVLTDDFKPESDVDVLVVFDKDEKADFFEKYFELKERLELIFNRKIDLIVDKQFRNPVFRNKVEKTRKIVYER